MKDNSMIKSIMLVGVGIVIGSGINIVSSSPDEGKTKSASSMPPPPTGPYRSMQNGGSVAPQPQARAPLYPPVNRVAPPWQQTPVQMMPPAMQHPAWRQQAQRPDWARPVPRPDWAKRSERPQRPEWAKRSEPPKHPDWAKRPEPPKHPDWAKRQERPQRPDWAKRPQRPDWAARPPVANQWTPPNHGYGYGYPPVPAYIAPWGYGPWGPVRR